MAAIEVLEIHTHSTASDGELSPSSLAALLIEKGVDLWSLTDHDTVAGCREAMKAVEGTDLRFVTGIEVSADLDGKSVHVLGYGVDLDDARLKSYGDEMVGARRDRMAGMVDRLNDLGVEVTMEDVEQISDGGNMCRPHLARALLKRGEVESIQQAFDRWIGNSRPGYVTMSRPSVAETIAMLQDAGGLVVLAHPARYGDLSDHFGRWKELGLWGLEARHPSHNRAAESRLVRLAQRHGLGTTASNDWHGHQPKDRERLGRVSFPEQWREPFLEALFSK